MKRAIFAIAFVLAIAPAAGASPPGGDTGDAAAPGGIRLADSHDDARLRVEERQRRELKRLRDERQRALDKAAKGGKQSRRRSRRRVNKDSHSPRQSPGQSLGRLALALPPGWEDAEKGMAAGLMDVGAIGDTPAFFELRTEMTVYTRGGEASAKLPEIILLERFRKSRTLSLDHIYRRWREKVNAGCIDGRETGPVDGEKDGQAVIDSYYTCLRRKADNRTQVSMLKVIDGPAELFVVSRYRLGPPSSAGKATDMELVIGDWSAWSASAARPSALPERNSRGDNGEKVSKGYGFVVSRRGHVVTVHSLVQDCRGLSFSSSPAALMASDPVKDLALFKLAAKPKAVAVFRKGLEAVRGDPVALPSYPSDGGLAIELSVSTGVISALIGPGGDPRFLSVTTPIPPGNSGLPLVDLGGAVAGMAMARAEAMKIAASPPGVSAESNFALSAKVLKAFLEGQGVDFETVSVAAILTPGEAAQRARAATVLVECRN